MSVIVKDMEMPKDCYECPLHDGENGKCNILGITVCDYIPKGCPLVEFRTAIDEMPNIKPERKKAKWSEKGVSFACTNCDYRVMEPVNCCPNCGAEMEGEK